MTLPKFRCSNFTAESKKFYDGKATWRGLRYRTCRIQSVKLIQTFLMQGFVVGIVRYSFKVECNHLTSALLIIPPVVLSPRRREPRAGAAPARRGAQPREPGQDEFCAQRPKGSAKSGTLFTTVVFWRVLDIMLKNTVVTNGSIWWSWVFAYTWCFWDVSKKWRILPTEVDFYKNWKSFFTFSEKYRLLFRPNATVVNCWFCAKLLENTMLIRNSFEPE